MVSRFRSGWLCFLSSVASNSSGFGFAVFFCWWLVFFSPHSHHESFTTKSESLSRIWEFFKPQQLININNPTPCKLLPDAFIYNARVDVLIPSSLKELWQVQSYRTVSPTAVFPSPVLWGSNWISFPFFFFPDVAIIRFLTFVRKIHQKCLSHGANSSGTACLSLWGP